MSDTGEYREFRVVDTGGSGKHGMCRSYYDHFDILWDDGTRQDGILCLSYYGIVKLPVRGDISDISRE